MPRLRRSMRAPGEASASEAGFSCVGVQRPSPDRPVPQQRRWPTFKPSNCAPSGHSMRAGYAPWVTRKKHSEYSVLASRVQVPRNGVTELPAVALTTTVYVPGSTTYRPIGPFSGHSGGPSFTNRSHSTRAPGSATPAADLVRWAAVHPGSATSAAQEGWAATRTWSTAAQSHTDVTVHLCRPW